MSIGRFVAPALLAAASIVTHAPAGRAAPIYVSNVQMGPYMSVTLSGAALGGSQKIDYVGQQIETANIGASYNAAGSFTLYAWCVDLNHNIYLGSQNQYQTGSLAQVNSSPAVNWSKVNQAQLVWLAFYGNQKLAKYTAADAGNYGTQAEFSAAVQVAIWNTEYGTTYTGSDSQIASDLVSLTNLWNNGRTSVPAQGGVAFALISNATPQTQELLTFVTGPSSATLAAAIPEPASAVLLAGGTTGLLLLRRRLRPRGRQRNDSAKPIQ